MDKETKKENSAQETTQSSDAGKGFDFGLTADELNRKVKFTADGEQKEATLKEVLTNYAPAGANFTKKSQNLADKVRFAEDMEKFGKTPEEVKENITNEYWGGVQNWLKTDAGKDWFKNTGEKLGLTKRETKEVKKAMESVVPGEEIPEEIKDVLGEKGLAWLQKMQGSGNKAIDEKISKLEEALNKMSEAQRTKENNAMIEKERENLHKKYPDLSQTKIELIEMYAMKRGFDAVQKGKKAPSFIEVYESIKDEISVPQSQLDKIKKETEEKFIADAKKVGEGQPTILGSGSAIPDDVIKDIETQGDFNRALSKALGMDFQPDPRVDPNEKLRK